MQGFLGRLSSLASKFHLRSDGSPSTPAGYPANAYDQETEYEPPVRSRTPASASGGTQGARQPLRNDPNEQGGYQAPVYEQTQGDGYTNAGVRLRTPARQKGEGILGGLKGLFARSQEPVYAAYEEPDLPDNIVQLDEHSTDATPYGNGSYRPTARSASSAAQSETISVLRQESNGKTFIQLVRRLEDAEEIIEYMISGGKVIINMEEIDDVLKQRMVDMISGAAFALQYKVKRFAYRNYLVAPNDEDIISNLSSREPVREEYDEEPPRASSRRFY